MYNKLKYFKGAVIVKSHRSAFWNWKLGNIGMKHSIVGVAWTIALNGIGNAVILYGDSAKYWHGSPDTLWDYSVS